MQREKVVQQQVANLLRSVGSGVFILGTRRRRDDYQGTMQTPGVPDVLAFVPNRGTGHWELLAVECKAPGGRLRPAQRVFQEYCQHAGIAHVVGGVDDVIAWLIQRGLVRAYQFPHYRVPAAPAPTKEVTP